jgi:hypothetical protein
MLARPDLGGVQVALDQAPSVNLTTANSTTTSAV